MSGTRAGASNSQGTTRSKGLDRGAAARRCATATAPRAVLLGKKLVDLRGRRVESLLGRGAALDRLLDRRIQLLDDLRILWDCRREVDDLGRVGDDRVIR